MSNLTKIKDYEPIAASVKDIDIGMLFLNAGWGQMSPFMDLRPEEIEQIVTINALHPCYLTKVLLKQLLDRKQRGAIVITSSGLAAFPAAGSLAYSASKAFASYFGQGLNYEIKDKIDVLSFECGETSTKLLRRKPSLTVPLPSVVTKACLRDLGKENLTYGCARHESMMPLVRIVPLSWI